MTSLQTQVFRGADLFDSAPANALQQEREAGEDSIALNYARDDSRELEHDLLLRWGNLSDDERVGIDITLRCVNECVTAEELPPTAEALRWLELDGADPDDWGDNDEIAIRNADISLGKKQALVSLLVPELLDMHSPTFQSTLESAKFWELKLDGSTIGYGITKLDGFAQNTFLEAKAIDINGTELDV